MGSRTVYFLLVAYWAALVIGTHVPAEQLPRSLDPVDKMIHLGAYAGLSVLLMFAVSRKWNSMQAAVWVWILLLLHGGIDEATQAFSPNRVPDVLDWVANSLGAAIGIGAFLVAAAAWHGRSVALKPSEVARD